MQRCDVRRADMIIDGRGYYFDDEDKLAEWHYLIHYKGVQFSSVFETLLRLMWERDPYDHSDGSCFWP